MVCVGDRDVEEGDSSLEINKNSHHAKGVKERASVMLALFAEMRKVLPEDPDEECP